VKQVFEKAKPMKNRNAYQLLPTWSAIVLSVVLVACGGKDPSASQTSKDSQTAAPAEKSIWLAQAPTDAAGILTSRAAEPGTPVVVQAVVGGVLRPFTDGFSTFVIGDESIVFCNEMEDDHCSTPWDACCEDREKLAISRALVQVVGNDGLPLAGSMRGANGLKELDVVTVVGVIAPESTPENLIINASQLYRHG
jgi:hypothetical protein